MSGLYGPPAAPLAGGIALTSGSIPFANASGALAGDGTTLNVKGFGAKGDGVTDDSAAINAAIAAVVAAGGGIVSFPAGTYIVTAAANTAAILMQNHVHLCGAGENATIIKLKDGTNGAVPIISHVGKTGLNTVADWNALVAQKNLTGQTFQGSAWGIGYWSIRDMTLDGNKTNNPTGGECLKVYSYIYSLDNVSFHDAHGAGLLSRWVADFSLPSGLQQMRMANIAAYSNDGDGIDFGGPHDALLDSITSALNGGIGLHLNCCPQPGVAGQPQWGANGTQVIHAHVWGIPQTYGIYVEPSCDGTKFTDVVSEGSNELGANGINSAQFYMGASQASIKNCLFYNANASLYQGAGFVLGPGANNNDIEFHAFGFWTHALDWGTSPGSNRINATINQPAAAGGSSGVAVVGKPLALGGATDDSYDILVYGGATGTGRYTKGGTSSVGSASAAAYVIAGSGTVTASGNEITDATRATGTQGDGRSGDSSYGIWNSTTNLVANGGAETNTTGATDHSSTTTRTTAEHKFGAACYQVVTSNATANEGPSWAISGGAAATQYTVSAWAKLISGAATVRVALSDSVSGKQGSAGVVLTTTWQRITVTATTGAASSGFAAYVETTAQASGTYVIDGIQVEAHNYATPYVETNGGTATRALATPTLPAGLLNPVQGWVAVCCRPGYASSGIPTDEANTPRAWGYGADTTNRFFLAPIASGWQGVRASANGTAGDTWNAGDMRVVITKWDSAKFYATVNGVTFGSGFSQPPTSTTAAYTFGIGYDPTVSPRQFDGEILWICGGIGTLTDADAAALNAIGATDPTIPQLLALNGGAANPTFLWTCATGVYTTLDPVFGQSSHRPSVQLGTATTAAAGANAGTTPPAPVLQNCTDEKGTITFGTGTTPAAGAQVVVTFGSSYGVTPAVTVMAGNSATQALGLYVSSKSATGFTLSTANAPSASQANTVYSFDYLARG